MAEASSHVPYILRDLRKNLAAPGPPEAAEVAAEAATAFDYLAAMMRYHSIELILGFGDAEASAKAERGLWDHLHMQAEAELTLLEFFPAAIVAYRRHLGATLH